MPRRNTGGNGCLSRARLGVWRDGARDVAWRADNAVTLEYRRGMTSPRRLTVALLGLACALAATVVLADAATKVRDGISYGKAEHLSGVYFTNFENSTFVRCDRARGECGHWTGSSERYGLACEPAACAALEARIKALNGSHDKWGLFAIDFTGRRSTGPDKSRWLGDPAKKVLVEQVDNVALLETQ